MSLLVNAKYKRQDSDDESPDTLVQSLAPPKKKIKSVAPEVLETQSKSQIAADWHFQTFKIVEPSGYTNQHLNTQSYSKDSSISPAQKHPYASTTIAQSDVQRINETSTSHNWLKWDIEAYAQYGSYLNTPEFILKHLNRTETKGESAARIPNKKIFSTTYSPQSSHRGPINSLKWSPSNGNLLLSSSMDGSVVVWDPFRSKKRVCEFFGLAGIRDATWHPDGKSIIYGGYDKKLCHVDIETGKALTMIDQEAFITCATFHNELSQDSLVCGLSNGCVMAFDPRDCNMIKSDSDNWLNSPSNPKLKVSSSGRFIRRIQGLPGQVLSMEFLRPTPNTSSDTVHVHSNDYFVTSCDPADKGALENSIVVWDFAGGTPLSNGIFCEPYPSTFLKQHPINSSFVAQCAGGYIPVFSGQMPFKRKKSKTFKGHTSVGYPTKLEFSIDGSILYSGTNTGQIYAYSWSSTKLLTTVPVFEAKDACTGLSHHPILESTLACGSWSGTITIYQ